MRRSWHLVGVAVAVSLLAAGCASSSSELERVAADARPPLDAVPTLRVERVELAAATRALPSAASSTTAALTTVAPTTAAPTSATPATAAPPTAAPTTATPATPAPRPAAPTTATATIAPRPAPRTSPPRTTAPAPAPTPPSATSTATPTPRLATSTTTPPTTTPPTTTPPTIASPGSAEPPHSPGFDGRTIRIGVLSTTKNPTWGQLGKAIDAGIEARVAAINRRGGIAGRYRVELVLGETDYDPSLTAQQLELTKDRVVAYASILGTPNVEAIEPSLRQLQMVAGAASQEARWSRTPNLLPVFNSYQVQAINGIGYYLANSGNPTANVCALRVDTSYGEAGAEGVRFAKTQLGFTLGPIESVAPTSTNVTANISALRNAKCEAVMLVTTPQQTLAAVLTARALAFSPRWIIMGASFSDRLITPQTGPLFEQGAWVVGDGTQWGDPTVPGMKQLSDELIASDNRYWTENPDVGLTFGWVQARVLEATLERAVARRDLSHAGVLAASREIGAVDVAGLGSPIDYSSADRLADARTTVFAVDGSYRNAIRVLAPVFTTAAAHAYRPGAS